VTVPRPQAVALVLAAGSGLRLGLGPKALLPWEGSVLVIRAVRAAVAAGLRPVVTAGPGYHDIAARFALDDVPATLVRVPDASVGMSASWKAGVAAIAEPNLADRFDDTDDTCLVVMLVDQPGVGPQVLRRLISHFRPDRVVRAAWDGMPGHPVAMPLRYARAAAELSTGDEGARAWIRRHRDLVDLVDCGDVGDGADLDTPGDLRRRSGELGS
jgi:nicotine blue oxidoreductase